MTARAGRWMRAVVLCGMAASIAVACGGDDDEDHAAVVPLVAAIEPAIAAVETELGGPQQFYEVNVTPQLVNLFVAAGGGDVVPYVYLDGELQAPAPVRSGATGSTFAGSAVDIDGEAIFDQIVAELDEPTIAQFVIVGGPGGTVRYSAMVTSDAGGTLEVVVAPDGAIAEVITS